MHTQSIPLTAVGPSLSRLVAGAMHLASWNLSPTERLQWVEACLELGITSFDHADIYGGYTCEGLFGEALALRPSLRSAMQLISKCGIKLVSPNRPRHRLKSYDTSREHIIASAENSLRELQTDYLDVLLIHRPSPLLDADEVAEAFGILHRAGKVLHFGVSNFTPAQFALLQYRLDLPLVTNQVELSVMQVGALTDGTLDQCQQKRIRPMIWSPLGGGALFRGDSAASKRLLIALRQVGEELGNAGPDQVALAWVLAHPSQPLPVLGTGKLARWQAAVAAQQITLSAEQWFTIWQAAVGREVD